MEALTSMAGTMMDPLMDEAERERLRQTRDYFESGCACLNTTKTLQPCPTNMPDQEAVAFYEKHCKCSRNYFQG